MRGLLAVPFESVDAVFVALKRKLRELLQTADAETKARVVLMGVASLLVFVQSNWTGPPLTNVAAAPIPSLSDALEQDPSLVRPLLAQLSLAGEEVWSKLVHPAYLLTAKVVFVDCASSLRDIPSVPWWAMRTEFLHQTLLPEPVPTLKDALADLSKEVISAYSAHPDKYTVEPGRLVTGTGVLGRGNSWGGNGRGANMGAP